jgi:hypothetical protein
MHYTLRGKIVRGLSYQIDKTLSVEGVSADSKATGDAINALRKDSETALSNHVNDLANPHGVTKVQVGLGNVDNTSDKNKPVSIAQAEAIADAKKAGTDAQTAAENAQASADEAKSLAESKAQEAEINAKNYTESKHNYFTVKLTTEGWTGETAPFTQTVAMEGIQETDTPHWGLVYSDSVAEGSGITVEDLKLAEKESYALVDDLDTANGSVTFTCLEEKPEVALTIQMEVNR